MLIEKIRDTSHLYQAKCFCNKIQLYDVNNSTYQLGDPYNKYTTSLSLKKYSFDDSFIVTSRPEKNNFKTDPVAHIATNCLQKNTNHDHFLTCIQKDKLKTPESNQYQVFYKNPQSSLSPRIHPSSRIKLL